jgi:endonuclease/exonuclease/phosphatase family metal-dependent hydrolase
MGSRSHPLRLLLLFACEEADPIRVATINLRHDADCWRERFELISAEIGAVAPDLIGMQEVEIAAEQAELLDADARGAGLAYEVHQEAKTGLAVVTGEGIAIFSRAPIVERSMLDLEYGRPAIIDRTEELTFVNTHLHNTGGDEVRRPQMEAILRAIEGEAGPVILTGDLNARPDSETYLAAIAAGFRDAGANAGDTSPIVLVKSATVAQSPSQRIDYILVRGPIEVIDARLAFDRPAPNGLYPSDHLGLVATLRLER